MSRISMPLLTTSRQAFTLEFAAYTINQSVAPVHSVQYEGVRVSAVHSGRRGSTGRGASSAYIMIDESQIGAVIDYVNSLKEIHIPPDFISAFRKYQSGAHVLLHPA